MRKERLKQEILEIIGSAILSGTEEAIIRAGIKMIVGMLSYMSVSYTHLTLPTKRIV